MTIDPTNADYIDSIEDPFLKSVAQQVVSVDVAVGASIKADDGEIVASANRRLEDMEIAVRKKLLELLLLHGNQLENVGIAGDDLNTAAADTIGVFWKSTLNVCHHLVHHALSPKVSTSGNVSYENLAPCRRLPYVLLSDCLEGLPSLEDAQHFWSNYVEPTLVNSLLFGDKFWRQLTEKNNTKKLTLPNSHLPFLKVANQFLKRLEHASDSAVRVEWKGRILWALAKGFSIADKSSLKSWGTFHTTNETDFENKEDFDESATVAVTPSKISIDYNLYEAFWSLQTDFANPNKINVGDFIKKLRLVLTAMESATATSSGANTSKSDNNNNNNAGHSSSTTNTTKYLTSSALLPFQIEDPAFRSSVVTQFLIVASHLGAESPPLKNALANLLGRARKLLKNDRPQLHEILWDSILANGREDDWRMWKKQKCAASTFAANFKRNHQIVLLDSGSTDDTAYQNKRRRLLSSDTTANNDVISSLSTKILDNKDFLAVSEDLRKKIPTLEGHLEPYVDALDPESGIEDEYHPKNDSLFTWRAMRLYAKHQLPLMSQCRQPEDLEKITRAWYRQSHGKEIPGRMQLVEESDTDNDNDNDGEKKEGASSANIAANDDHNEANKNDETNIDTEMEDVEEAGMSEKDGKNNDHQETSDTNDSKEDNVNEKNETTAIEEASSVDNVDTNEGGEEDKEAEKTDNREPSPAKESLAKTESKMQTQSRTPKTFKAEEQIEKTTTVEAVEASKPDSAVNSDAKKVNDDREKSNGDRDRNNNQGHEKRAPWENTTPHNRGGGRRPEDAGRNDQDRDRRYDGGRNSHDNSRRDDGGRNSQGNIRRDDGGRNGKDTDRRDDGGRQSQQHGRRDDGGRNSQERGRRDDALPSRRRGEDVQQSRGRHGGESSYRGRSDGPPSRRGGRYDDDYRGDNRGERSSGDRDSRSGSRDDGGNRGGGERGGGPGRDEHRGERSGDRGRRNNDDRAYSSGGGRRRR